jgi:sulfite dehydrogenase
VGPVLDELKPDAARVAKAMRNGIGAMPSYSAALTAEQIDTVAFYVSSVSGR